MLVTNLSSCSSPEVFLLHVHWHDKEVAPPGIHLIVGIFITVVGLVALVGNSLVVLTCIRFKELRTRSNLLILNLAVGDLLMCSIDFPLLALASFHHCWPFGEHVCRLYAFLTAVAGMVTINSLAAISADRYWAVVRRSSPGQRRSKCVMSIVIASVWAYSIAWALCPLLGWGNYVLDGIQTTCTFDYLTRSFNNRSFVMAMSFGNFVLPFLIMVFSYTQIWVTIREVKSGLEKQVSLVSIGSCTYSSIKHGSRSISSVDERYSKMSIKFEPSSTSITSTMRKKRLDSDELSTDISDPLDISVGNLDKQQQEEVSFTLDSSTKEDFSMCVKKNYFREHVIIKQQQQQQHLQQQLEQQLQEQPNPRLKFQDCDLRNNDTISGNRSGNHIIKHGIRFYKPNCTFLNYNRSGKRETTKTEFVPCNTSRKYGFVQNSPYPQMSSFSVEKYNVSSSKNINKHKDSCTSVTSGYGESNMKRRCSRFFSYNIRMKYRAAFGNGLFLKQHQYRLHCEQKTMKIIMFLLFAFIVSWCPYMIISLIGLFGDASGVTYLTSVFPSLLAKTSMVFNPILYSISHPKVRKRIIALFRSHVRSINSKCLVLE